MQDDLITFCVSNCLNNLMPWIVLLAFVIWPIVCICGIVYDLKREKPFINAFFKNFALSIGVFPGFISCGFCILFLGSLVCGMVWELWNYAMKVFQ